jgi:hypothetical protein
MNKVLFASPGDVYMLLGVFLFFAGTMLGVPHGRSKRRGEVKRTELWRVAHLSTCLGGVSLIALSVALIQLFGADASYTMLPLCGAAYCFFFACTLSACLNKAWDEDRVQPSVMLVYRLQILASALSVIAVLSFLLTLIFRWVL